MKCRCARLFRPSSRSSRSKPSSERRPRRRCRSRNRSAIRKNFKYVSRNSERPNSSFSKSSRKKPSVCVSKPWLAKSCKMTSGRKRPPAKSRNGLEFSKTKMMQSNLDSRTSCRRTSG
jgi:hypothetical protein